MARVRPQRAWGRSSAGPSRTGCPGHRDGRPKELWPLPGEAAPWSRSDGGRVRVRLAGPVVTRIAEEGPAARAGLLVGDVISAIGTQTVETAAAVGERLSALDPEAIVTLAVIRRGRAETLELLLGSSPSVPVSAGSTPLYPVVLTLLNRRLETRDTSEPAWVIQLNQAVVLMRAGAWEQAVDALRQIPDAPTGPGLGRAAVDYWFGIAASALGPGYYDIARAAFSRTASVPGATLFHNDGPLVAPRAQARLLLLGGSSPPQ